MLSRQSKNRTSKWQGQTVVCIASGPSLTKEDVEYVRGRAHRVMVVNREFEMAPWADVLYGADYRFWEAYWNEIDATFTGERWTMSQQAASRFKINCIGRCNAEGYSIIAGSINTGGNSGFQAVHLAAYWGASRIVLLGYDMQRTDGKEHHYGKHKNNLPNGRSFPFWVKRFAPLVRDLSRMGVEVLNCSRASALTCGKRVTLESVKW